MTIHTQAPAQRKKASRKKASNKKLSQKKPVTAIVRTRGKTITLRGRGDYFKDAGSAVGGWVGERLGGWLKKIFGVGDYELGGGGAEGISSNSLVAGSSIPVMHSDNGGSSEFFFHEFVGNIPMTVDFSLQTFPINVTNSQMFPWLHQVAKGYQQYEIVGAVFVLRSLTSNVVLAPTQGIGSVFGSIRYDVNSDPPADKSAILNSMFSSSAKPSENQAFPLECARSSTVVNTLKIAPAGLSPPDLQFYQAGWLDIATEGAANDFSDALELHVTYHVRFYKPRIDQASSGRLFMMDLLCTSLTTPLYPIPDTPGLKQPRVDTIGATVGSGYTTISLPPSLTAGSIWRVELAWSTVALPIPLPLASGTNGFVKALVFNSQQNHQIAAPILNGATGFYTPLLVGYYRYDGTGSLTYPPTLTFTMSGTTGAPLGTGTVVIQEVNRSVATGITSAPQTNYTRQHFLKYIIDSMSRRGSHFTPPVRHRLVDWLSHFTRHGAWNSGMPFQASHATFDVTLRDALEVMTRLTDAVGYGDRKEVMVNDFPDGRSVITSSFPSYAPDVKTCDPGDDIAEWDEDCTLEVKDSPRTYVRRVDCLKILSENSLKDQCATRVLLQSDPDTTRTNLKRELIRLRIAANSVAVPGWEHMTETQKCEAANAHRIGVYERGLRALSMMSDTELEFIRSQLNGNNGSVTNTDDVSLKKPDNVIPQTEQSSSEDSDYSDIMSMQRPVNPPGLTFDISIVTDCLMLRAAAGWVRPEYAMCCLPDGNWIWFRKAKTLFGQRQMSRHVWSLDRIRQVQCFAATGKRCTHQADWDCPGFADVLLHDGDTGDTAAIDMEDGKITVGKLGAGSHKGDGPVSPCEKDDCLHLHYHRRARPQREKKAENAPRKTGAERRVAKKRSEVWEPCVDEQRVQNDCDSCPLWQSTVHGHACGSGGDGAAVVPLDINLTHDRFEQQLASLPDVPSQTKLEHSASSQPPPHLRTTYTPDPQVEAFTQEMGQPPRTLRLAVRGKMHQGRREDQVSTRTAVTTPYTMNTGPIAATPEPVITQPTPSAPTAPAPWLEPHIRVCNSVEDYNELVSQVILNGRIALLRHRIVDVFRRLPPSLINEERLEDSQRSFAELHANLWANLARVASQNDWRRDPPLMAAALRYYRRRARLHGDKCFHEPAYILGLMHRDVVRYHRYAANPNTYTDLLDDEDREYWEKLASLPISCLHRCIEQRPTRWELVLPNYINVVTGATSPRAGPEHDIDAFVRGWEHLNAQPAVERVPTAPSEPVYSGCNERPVDGTLVPPICEAVQQMWTTVKRRAPEVSQEARRLPGLLGQVACVVDDVITPPLPLATVRQSPEFEMVTVKLYAVAPSRENQGLRWVLDQVIKAFPGRRLKTEIVVDDDTYSLSLRSLRQTTTVWSCTSDAALDSGVSLSETEKRGRRVVVPVPAEFGSFIYVRVYKRLLDHLVHGTTKEIEQLRTGNITIEADDGEFRLQKTFLARLKTACMAPIAAADDCLADDLIRCAMPGYAVYMRNSISVTTHTLLAAAQHYIDIAQREATFTPRTLSRLAFSKGSPRNVVREVGPHRVFGLLCRTTKPFQASNRFRCTRGAEFFIAGELVFTSKDEDMDGNYRTLFGPTFVSDWVVYRKCNHNIALALRRLTCVVAPETPGLDQALEVNQRQFIKQHRVIFDQLAVKWGAAVEQLSDEHTELFEHYADPHPKKMLRIAGCKDLLATGAAARSGGDWMIKPFVEGNMKPERAKSGKLPRMVINLGVTSSLLGFMVTAILKEAMAAEPIEYLGGIIVFVMAPKPVIMDKYFNLLITCPWRYIYIFFSDDGCLASRIADPTVVRWYNIDIASCDSSHRPALFALLKRLPTRHAHIFQRLVNQCRRPIRVYDSNTRSRKTFIELTPTGPFMYSGSTLTTIMANLASMFIAMSIAEGDGTDLAADAHRVGYHITGVDTPLTHPEELQFLKHSPIIADDGEYHSMLNLGVLLRTSGMCNGDLPGRGGRRARAVDFQASLIQGAFPGVHCQLLDAMRYASRTERTLYDTSKEFAGKVHERPDHIRFSDASISKRYSITPHEYDVLCDFAQAGVGYTIACDASLKILNLDYGLGHQDDSPLDYFFNRSL